MIDSPALLSGIPARTVRLNSDACNPEMSLVGDDVVNASILTLGAPTRPSVD